MFGQPWNLGPIRISAEIRWAGCHGYIAGKNGGKSWLSGLDVVQFIRNYADHARPLTSLTGNAEFSWTPEQQESFDKLKSLITSSPILVSPNPELPYRVEADASEGAIGAVLSSRQGEKWHPVAYISKAMSPTERNYEIYDKELFAIVYALEKWRPYLLGAKHSVEILTDHQNLTYFRQPQKLNRRQARWYSELAQYDFTLTHRPG